jgi:hypothetical protein
MKHKTLQNLSLSEINNIHRLWRHLTNSASRNGIQWLCQSYKAIELSHQSENFKYRGGA